MMSDIGKNRTLLASIAAIAIIVGLVFLGGMPKGETPVSPAASQAAPSATGSDGAQAEQFAVRDYSDFGQGAGVDLPSSDWLGLLAGMVLKLAFVIGLIYLVVLVLKRYYRRGRTAASTRKPVSVLSSTNLAPNRTVYVLEVARKVLVVGATTGQLSLLTEVTDPEAIEEVRLLSAESPGADQFGSLLSAFGRRLGDQDGELPSSPIVTSLQAKVREGRDFVHSKVAQVKQSRARDLPDS